MSKLDDFIAKHAPDEDEYLQPIFRDQDNAEMRRELREIVLETYEAAKDLRNHTGLSLDSAFKQLVEEL